ncbi:MAG: PAS domain S-box protein [Deltaproteobacteria bacterium]|nr:PAS domain S-box protein [Deltaproteobacteria bacterium]
MKDERKTKAQLLAELQALRQSEEQYRQLFESANDAIVIFTLQGIVTSVNGGLEVMLGWSREELIGQHYRKFVPPASVVLGEERTRRFLTGDRLPSIFAAEMMHKDGSVVPVEARTRPIRDNEGKPVAIQGIYRDITARKQAEEALRESEQRYRGLVESQQDLIVRVDPQGRFTFVNDAYGKKFAKQREELIGKTFMPLVHEDDLAATFAVMKGLEVPPYRVSLEQRALTAEGWRWLAWEDYAIRDEHGQTLEIQAVGRDITDRKQAQAEREKLQEQLFQARKLEALGTLAGGVAHDFNNILSAIMGFTELATDEVPEGTLARRNLEEVLKASRRAKALVQQILTFSRPSQQKHQSPQPQLIVEEVLTFLRASLPPTIELRQHLDQTAGPVAINASQLQQVLTNLCANAIQALGERGGVMEIRLQQTDLDDLARARENLNPGLYMKLTVRDTGCGMAPMIQERIFEPFFTTRPVGEGNGLGLAIVHGIVTGCGGEITVASAPGEGTTFEVYLPIGDSEVAAAPGLHPSSPPAEAPGGDEKGALSDATHFSH